MIFLLLLDDLDLLEGNEIRHREHRNQPEDQVEPSLEKKLQPPAVETVQSFEGEVVKALHDGIGPLVRPAQHGVAFLRVVRRQGEIDAKRNEDQRDEQGGEQRNGQWKRQPHEEKLPLALHQRHGHKHHNRRQRRHGDREGDFARAFHARVAPGHSILVHPLDVFGHHDRVIHQHPDGDDEGENGEKVERFAGEEHHGQRHQGGKRNRESDDGRQPKAEQKNEKHERRQHSADDSTVDQVAQ